MAGCVSGVAARIQSQFPLALYTHCFSHKLNPVIVDACKVLSVRNAMGIISKVALFFENSPKRPALPRRCGRQRGRNNVLAEEPAECYKRSITIPFLDHLPSHSA